MNIESVKDKLRALGVTIPTGTIRRWSAEGLIPPPLRVQNPDGRGWLSDWPEATVEEAAAVWAVRHLNTKVAAPTVDVIKEVKRLVPQVYEAPWELRTWAVAPDGKRGIYLGSAELHPHLLLWVITIEKVRRNWPIVKPARVTVILTREVNPDGTRSNRFEGIALESANENGLRITQKASSRTGLELLIDEKQVLD